jgi:uncharacterized protein (TIGR02466 family)
MEILNKPFLIENWFSSPIYSSSAIEWVEKLKPFLLEQLNKDTINKKRFYKGRTTHSTNINLAECDELKDFTTFLMLHAKTFLENLGFDYEKISKKFSPYYFTTELNKGSMQERHIHAFQLSGILYIKVPKNSAPIQFLDPVQIREYMDWPVKNPENQNTFSTVTYTPHEGSLLLWPSFLYHQVMVHQVNENRIGLVVNL